jgi:hypothetical protein
MGYADRCSFDVLKDKTITKIDGAVSGSEEIRIFCSDDTQYRMDHSQYCCESVYVSEIIGDISDIVDSPILLAEEVSEDGSGKPHPHHDFCYMDSATWTFYKLSTIKGSVTIRWLGESNGYYSESVDFEEVK